MTESNESYSPLLLYGAGTVVTGVWVWREGEAAGVPPMTRALAMAMAVLLGWKMAAK